MPAEAEAVRQHHVGVAPRAATFGHVVEVARRVGRVEVDRRRQEAAPGAPARRSTASVAPAAPSMWPVIDFVEETGTSYARSSPKTQLQDARLGGVADRRRGAVRVHVVRPRPGSRPASARAIVIARGRVLARSDRARSRGARRTRGRSPVTSARMLGAARQRRARAPPAPAPPPPSPITRPSRLEVERPARARRVVVARRQRPHAVEAADAHRRHGGLGAAGEHHVGHARAGCT